MFPYAAAPISALPTGYSYPAGYRGGYSPFVGAGVNPYQGAGLTSTSGLSYPYSTYPTQFGYSGQYGLTSPFAPSYVIPGATGFGVAGAVKPKLTYFDIDGRAEPTRLAFYIGGVDFEDERITGEEWQKQKENARFGQLPLLEVGGRVLAQTFAQLIFAGQLSGLYPTDAWEQAKVHEALFYAEDFSGALRPSMVEQDAEKKKVKRAKFVEEMPKFLKAVEGLFEAAGTGFLGAKFSVADLYWYSLFNVLSTGIIDDVPTDATKDYPLITAFLAKVSAIPKVAEWNAKKAQAKAEKAKAAEEAQKAQETAAATTEAAAPATETPAQE